DGVLVKFGGASAAVGLGLDGPGGAAALQEADEEGQVDGEQVGKVAQRVLAAINGSDDAFAEIVGVRTHGSTSSGSPPSHSIPYVTRMRTALDQLTMQNQLLLRVSGKGEPPPPA